MPHYRTILGNEEPFIYLKKKFFCFFLGRSLGVSVTSITVMTGISA